MREIRIKVGEGIAGWVARHATPILSNDVERDPRYARRISQATKVPVKSILCVPLIAKGRVLGVLNIINKSSGEPFTGDDLHIATAFANQAAIAIENAKLYEAMSRENRLLRQQLDTAPRLLKSFNPRMRAVIEMARRAADSDATMLLLGESGTGKEIVARAIHTWSMRNHYPFLALNCAALPEELLESELFGHEKGAFTGAVRRKEGKLEIANGGTLFLDEIGDLKYDLQTKLLRVIQEQQFERVGGTETIVTDVRFIAATNRNLFKEVQKKRFREDLFYRLDVISLTIPPLRERREDILFIANQFIERYCRDTGRTRPELTPEARDMLVNYRWPGNIRELENVLERAIVLTNNETLTRDDLFIDARPGSNATVDCDRPFRELVREYKRTILQEALRRSGGNQSRAAEMLSIAQPYFSRLLKELGLR